MKYYYADKNQVPVGPYTTEELKQLNVNGVVHPDTWICAEGASQWQPYTNLLLTSATVESSAIPPPPNSIPGNPNPSSTGTAVLWFLCCFPIGFMQWGQTAKGWVWFLIAVITGGVGTIPACIDYWMNFAVQSKRQVGEWEFFPTR